MSCCDDYGNCRQGRDCPVRSTPIQAREGGWQIDTESHIAGPFSIHSILYALAAATAGWLLMAWGLGILL
jgi:hypothetical protein